MTTMIEYADKIRISSDRLYRFVKVGAPLTIIESERRLLIQRIMDFPVDGPSQEYIIQCQDEKYGLQQKHLMSTGYYDDFGL